MSSPTKPTHAEQSQDRPNKFEGCDDRSPPLTKHRLRIPGPERAARRARGLRVLRLTTEDAHLAEGGLRWGVCRDPCSNRSHTQTDREVTAPGCPCELGRDQPSWAVGPPHQPRRAAAVCRSPNQGGSRSTAGLQTYWLGLRATRCSVAFTMAIGARTWRVLPCVRLCGLLDALSCTPNGTRASTPTSG